MSTQTQPNEKPKEKPKKSEKTEETEKIKKYGIDISDNMADFIEDMDKFFIAVWNRGIVEKGDNDVKFSMSDPNDKELMMKAFVSYRIESQRYKQYSNLPKVTPKPSQSNKGGNGNKIVPSSVSGQSKAPTGNGATERQKKTLYGFFKQGMIEENPYQTDLDRGKASALIDQCIKAVQQGK